MYTIKEVSKMMGISAYTLRYYEKIGLLEFVHRNANGIRQFNDSDILTLNTIHRLKETGMPLQEIKHYLKLIDEGIDSVSERKEIMQAQHQKFRPRLRSCKRLSRQLMARSNITKRRRKRTALVFATMTAIASSSS
jgi:DNA-binding transcriptional MerR regulator